MVDVLLEPVSMFDLIGDGSRSFENMSSETEDSGSWASVLRFGYALCFA
jgi:hypothetical protein